MLELELVLPMTSREAAKQVLSFGFLGLGMEIGKLEDTTGRSNKAQAVKLECDMAIAKLFIVILWSSARS